MPKIKFIVDGEIKEEFELIKTDSSTFIVVQKKDSKPLPLLSFKEGWNDPSSDTIERKYKSIKIGDEYYSMSPLNT